MQSLYKRNSSIELLKIFAMSIIVISHVTWSVLLKPLPEMVKLWPFMKAAPFHLLNSATRDPEMLGMLFLRSLGNFGNDIFFICSVWFLSESRRAKTDKIISMLLNIWIVSMVFLGVFSAIYGKLPSPYVKKSIFPTLYMNNWYMTAYLMVYAIHPALNRVIEAMDRKALTLCSIVFFVMFSVIASLYTGAFFMNNLVGFIAMYFIVACIRRDWAEKTGKKWTNAVLLLASLACYAVLLIVSNKMGLESKQWKNLVMYWITNQNPFLFIGALAVFNLFRVHSFNSKAVNRISSLTMLIYLIHENLVFRRFGRPALLFMQMKELPGLGLAGNILLFSLLLFIATIAISWLYDVLIGKWVGKLSSLMSKGLRKAYDAI